MSSLILSMSELRDRAGKPTPRDRYLEGIGTLNSNARSPRPSPAAIVNVKTVFERAVKR